MDQVMQFILSSKMNICTLFTCAEFQKTAMATAIGFAIMGFIGFKLVHIPINNTVIGG
uniref:Protein transport protein Sec61 subunit gamma n=1 Tax=Scleropages formosus TaxID=113540 RepID=A0A8C9V7C1_SCLFO